MYAQSTNAPYWSRFVCSWIGYILIISYTAVNMFLSKFQLRVGSEKLKKMSKYCSLILEHQFCLGIIDFFKNSVLNHTFSESTLYFAYYLELWSVKIAAILVKGMHIATHELQNCISTFAVGDENIFPKEGVGPKQLLNSVIH